jgi:hypothetical protein
MFLLSMFNLIKSEESLMKIVIPIPKLGMNKFLATAYWSDQLSVQALE